MEKVSIVIPVFRESEKLENLLIELLKDKYPQKEIITVVDEPNDKSLVLSKRYKNRIKFILNEKRLGKVKASNLAAERSSGDILFFLDSDNTINNDEGDLIQKIVDEIDGYDYGALKITVNKKSILSKMSYYDYINTSFVNYIFSKFLKRTPIMGGQAFVMRKEIFNELNGFEPEILEDFDICTKAFLKKSKFRYLKDIEVITGTPDNWSEWLKQRTRWCIGATFWFKKYYKSMIKNTVIHPHLFLSSFFVYFPTILLFLINFLLSNSLLEKLIYFTLLLIPFKSIEALPFIFLIFSSMTLIKSVFLYLLAFSISCSMTFFTAKIMNYKFSLKEYAFYYFVYAPLSLTVYIGSSIKGLILSSKLKDWKV